MQKKNKINASPATKNLKRENQGKTSKNFKFLIFILLAGQCLIVLAVACLGFYFHYLMTRQSVIINKELDQFLWQFKQGGPVAAEVVPPSVRAKLKESGIDRYFLAKIDLINGYYTPTVHLCLFENGDPVYSQYLYETWAIVTHPKDLTPVISLVKYQLLPEDNDDFQLDKNCFIKEIKTENDWRELKDKYGFSKDQFQ